MAGHGGARRGAGRKPKAVKELLAPIDAAVVLRNVDAATRFKHLAENPDPYVSMKALMYLWDRAEGKPKQAIAHEGGEVPLRVVVLPAVPAIAPIIKPTAPKFPPDDGETQ